VKLDPEAGRAFGDCNRNRPGAGPECFAARQATGIEWRVCRP
jgi:hypothetical protein